MSQTIAVFPGQFDPITKGHLDVIRRAAPLFDQLIVAVGTNPDKRELFTPAERVAMIQPLLEPYPNCQVFEYSGLTVDFAQRRKATVLLRGIRDVSDLRFEFQMAQVNRAVGGVETIFMMAGDEFALTSSSLIRQIIALGGNPRLLSAVLPETVIDQLAKKHPFTSNILPSPEQTS
ncbi:MAG TPA: pantetheine-phosphate adenylyltransferase [Tepidisphaeraceae bacterium]|nr:pantetheine-phosphate adenylyltransferase [Tepidisphaeraceae bacterium]